MALRDNQLDEAARRFCHGAELRLERVGGGPAGVSPARGTDAAADAIRRTPSISGSASGRASGPTFLQALGPRPQYAVALTDWGGAHLLAGDLAGAIVTLDASLQAESANAHALFLRARAKELSGKKDAALADYNLASRTAFAAAQDLASGEAHLYRGIVLFRRKDFARAEEEFASALNFEMTDSLLPDARAWRHLSAVAGGSCGPARQSLECRAGYGFAVFSPGRGSLHGRHLRHRLERLSAARGVCYSSG